MPKIKNSSFRRFLARYTKIPAKFIDEFFNIVPEDYESDHDFIINLSTLANWIDVRKDSLKRNLTKFFKQDVDYTIESVKDTDTNADTEIIMLTPVCTKKLCLGIQVRKSKNVKNWKKELQDPNITDERYEELENEIRADELRVETVDNIKNYFIELERLVKIYNRLITEKLKQSVKMLQKNRKPKKKMEKRRGRVYLRVSMNVIPYQEDDDPDIITGKVGATIDQDNRDNTYDSGNANKGEYVIVIEVDDVYEVERCIKAFLKRYQIHPTKETYTVHRKIATRIFSCCKNLHNGLVKWIEKNNLQQYVAEDMTYKRTNKKDKGAKYLDINIMRD